MKLGANDVSGVKIGATDVNKVYLGSNLVWEKASPLLLDDYPNAAAAYSLRKLKADYTGAAIKVRRSSDNTEQDIGFVDNELDTASLLSFVGAGNGFVTTWYDQSGGNDAVETTASGQASIVLSGVLNTTNGNVAAFGNSNTAYATGFSIFNGADGTYSGFVVSKLVSAFDGVMQLNNLSSGGGGEIFRYFNTSSTTFRIQSWDSSGGAPLLVTEPISANSNVISSFIRRLDSLTTSSNSLTNSLLGLGAPRKNVEDKLFIMGFNGATSGLESYFSEAILYPSDQTSNRVGIESNINSHYNVFWDGSQTGILDDYPNAEAAYSLRALNSAYTSSAIRVRRSSDNAERDIGLLYDGSLDTSSLLSFVGAGDGFVTIWYDQSGEGNDAAQGSASKQPKIVSSGVVITENGEPSVEFNGTTDYIQNELSVEPTVTAFAVSKIVSEPDYNFIYDSFGTNSRLRLGLWFTQEYFADNGDGLIVEATTASDGNQHLFFAKHSNSEVSISVDQDTLQTTSTTNFSQNSEHWNIGARNDGADHFLDGTIQELIIYPSDESTNRAGIESNVNEHYNVFWDGSQDGLLDDYPNAAAAYSLRALSSAYTGAAIEVRKTVAGATSVQDIGFLYDGSLDTASLLSFAGSDDVFVAKWYDQSGEGIDIENITASKQPKLVNNGILETKGGLPVAKFSGGQVLNATIQGDFLGVSGRTSFAVAYGDNVDSTFVRFSDNFDALGAGADGLSFAVGTSSNDVGVRNYQASPSINESQTLPYTLSDIVLMSHITTGSTGLTYIDSQAATGSAGLRGGSWYWGVGARATTLTGALNGGIFEAIHFASDQTSNRVGIETNINNHYTIY
jgi:hypothetical protein